MTHQQLLGEISCLPAMERKRRFVRFCHYVIQHNILTPSYLLPSRTVCPQSSMFASTLTWVSRGARSSPLPSLPPKLRGHSCRPELLAAVRLTSNGACGSTCPVPLRTCAGEYADRSRMLEASVERVRASWESFKGGVTDRKVALLPEGAATAEALLGVLLGAHAAGLAQWKPAQGRGGRVSAAARG